MTLVAVFAAARRHWKTLVAGVLVGILASVAWVLFAPKTYESVASGFVTVETQESNAGLASAADALAKSRAISYVETARSLGVAERVIADLNLDTEPSALVSRISVTVPPATVNLKVTAEASTPRAATNLANAWVSALSAQIAELEGTEAGSGSGIALVPVDNASEPSSPASPNTRLTLALGVVGGLLLGAVVVAIQMTFDRRIRSAAAIENEVGVSVLGTLPFGRDMGDGRLADLNSTSADSPDRAYSEAMRELRTNIEFIDVDNPPHAFVVTSPLPGDGKSSTAANLARTIARAGHNVVLVDADLRRPTVAKTFGRVGVAGLTSVLIGSAEISDVLHQVEDNLFILPTGPIPPNPSEILGSEAFKRLIEMLEQEAIVVIDSPPLLPVTDSAVLSARTDGAFVVVSAGKTTIDELQKAVSNIARVNGRMFGVVINRVPVRTLGRSSYGYYGYDYSYSSSKEAAEEPIAEPTSRPAAAPVQVPVGTSAAAVDEGRAFPVDLVHSAAAAGSADDRRTRRRRAS